MLSFFLSIFPSYFFVKIIVYVPIFLEAKVENAVTFGKVVDGLLDQFFVSLDHFEYFVKLALINVISLKAKLCAFFGMGGASLLFCNFRSKGSSLASLHPRY